MTTRESSRRAVVLLSALSPALVAADAPSPLEIDACSLLSGSEISEVIRTPVESGERHDLGLQENRSYSSTCVWKVSQPHAAENPDAPLRGASFVIVNAMRWPAGSGLAATFLQAFRDAAQRGEIPSQPTPRTLGDEALWWGDGLAVRSGDVSFGVSVFLPKSPDTRPGDREERLAQRILINLTERQ